MNQSRIICLLVTPLVGVCMGVSACAPTAQTTTAAGQPGAVPEPSTTLASTSTSSLPRGTDEASINSIVRSGKPGLIPVSDSAGHQAGFVDVTRMRQYPQANSEMAPVTSEDGKLVGYFVPTLGFVPLDETNAPGFDVRTALAAKQAQIAQATGTQSK